MLSVIQRKERRSADVVRLTDGRVVKAPKGMFTWGSVVYNDDIVKTDNMEYSHKSLIPPVKEKKPRDYYLCRDLTGYDPKEELALIRSCILKVFREIMGRGFWYSDELDDLVARFAELFSRRHIYQKFSPSHKPYTSYDAYAKAVVVNMLRDYQRELSTRLDTNALSLDIPVGENNDSENGVFLKDTSRDVVAEYEAKALYEVMYARTLELDKEGTGLPGFSYKEVFNILINGESLDDYFKKFKYPKDLLEQYVYDYRAQLHEAVSDMVVGY